MIVTLTCHPALEHTLCLPDPVRGGVNLATGSTLQPGGQGVHVARVLHANGDRVTAVLPCGGVTGRQLAILLTDAMVPFCPVPVAGAVRINTAIVEPDGTTSRYHETGPRLGSADGLALLACTDELLGQASWLAVCGSLPPGLPEDFYATVTRRARTYGVRVALDAPGPALARVLTEGPDLICPNRAELATAVGRDLDSLEQVAQAGRDLVRGGIPMVIVTLGADGAILVTDRATVHARARPVRPVCTLAAGEALLAGVLHGLQHGADPARALATGVAWGTAAVLQPGTRPPGPTDVAATAAALPAGVGGPVARTGQTASPRAGPSVRGHHRWHVPRPARPHHRA